MRLENIYKVDAPYRDGYTGASVTPKNFLTWAGGNSPVRTFPGLHVVSYSPTQAKTLTLRKATHEELEELKQTLINVPLGQLFSIRGATNCGADPELFAVNSKGKLIPAWEWLPSKTEAKARCQEPLYWDGFQGEFEVNPGQCLAGVVDSFQSRIKALQKKLHAYDPAAKLVGDCVLPVPRKALEEGDLKYIQLGCAPSLNAYNAVGHPIDNGRTIPIRFAGCHCHISKGYNARLSTPEEVAPRIKAIDAIAGVMSVSVLEGLESPLRRMYYGLAGEYRIPKHGLEYRVFSSAILWHPMLVHLHFNFARLANELAGASLEWMWKAEESEVQHAINALDVPLAREILLRNRGFLEKALWGLYHDPTQPNLGGECTPKGVPAPDRIVDEFLLKGVKGFITLDLAKNWHLGPSGEWAQHSEGPEVMVWRAMRSWLKG